MALRLNRRRFLAVTRSGTAAATTGSFLSEASLPASHFADMSRSVMPGLPARYVQYTGTLPLAGTFTLLGPGHHLPVLRLQVNADVLLLVRQVVDGAEHADHVALREGPREHRPDHDRAARS
jgi:hypothetical protein